MTSHQTPAIVSKVGEVTRRNLALPSIDNWKPANLLSATPESRLASGKGEVDVSKTLPPRSLTPPLVASQPRPSTSRNVTASSWSKVKTAPQKNLKPNSEGGTAPEMSKPSGSEDKRSHVRRKLVESLRKRLELAKDKEADHAVVEQVAEEIEEALHRSLDREKYMNKYRTLRLNISNLKHSRLFLDIAKKRLSPGN
ncbi:hypothetical protein DAPPUDRAFT_331565 [Daphnia pulex]|uniref:TFIIS central domain-containing protein n=1 Tax=Daphnia pulex TaxID=6669 RepID=E9HMT9_DAPPU|nr:hypothetical protein DAPPUDRAFT_339524 [Daphnia pulex]EFX66922.1 hypothetical protein DAPPUDRAFT_331565 [Daphnia pulex]|eukprot:EFX61443.1 hypothetical protein DAPPUDRAFT_339524 [Daphnia pulex]